MKLSARFFSTICLLVLLSFSVSAQKGYYNALMQHSGAEVPFQEEVKEVKYMVDNSPVIEYYSLNSNRFLGIHINQESVDASKLKFVKKNKQLRNLIKKKGLKEALTFLYDNISPGMTTEEVYSILGKPSKFRYGIDASSQIMNCYFVDSIYASLVFRDDVLEKINYL